MTTYKALSNGEGLSGSSAQPRQEPKERLPLGALELTADEIAQFEEWTTEPSKPTEFMLLAAKTHKTLQLKLKR